MPGARGVGVLLDTLVVRTVLVPALALLLDDAFRPDRASPAAYRGPGRRRRRPRAHTARAREGTNAAERGSPIA
ncbi:MAG: MMPL family transporter [Propionibacteriaceae bacterium]